MLYNAFQSASHPKSGPSRGGVSTSRVIRVRWTRPTQHRKMRLDLSSFRTAHDTESLYTISPWVTVRFQLRLPVPGTHCRLVRDQQSLAAFRQQLKTVLFRTSFGEDANT